MLLWLLHNDNFTKTIETSIEVTEIETEIIFSNIQHSFMLFDTASLGALVGYLTATSSTSQFIEYTLTNCSEFAISSINGQLTVANDNPPAGTYNCRVSASISNVMTSLNFSILVSTMVDFDADSYIFNTITAAISGIAFSSVLALTTGLNSIIYSFDGTCEGYDINSGTGEILVSSDSLVVGMSFCNVLTSVESVQDRATVTIIVTESDILFNMLPSYSFLIDHGLVLNNEVGKISAVTLVTDYPIIYSFDDICTDFVINSSSGVITVSTDSLLVGDITCRVVATYCWCNFYNYKC